MASAASGERVQPSGHSALSHLARLSAALGSRDAMYHLDTGLTNEHVPLNTDKYYLPFWQVGEEGLSAGGAAAAARVTPG